jgi:hypothetical protein
VAQSRKVTRKQSGRSSGNASRAQSLRAKKKRSAGAERRVSRAKAGKAAKSVKAKRSAVSTAKADKPKTKPRPKTKTGKAAVAAAAGARAKRGRTESRQREAAEPVPATELPRGRRFEAFGLVGESEYSARAARGRPRRGAGLVTEGRLPEDPADPTPETLGRHFLEEVTEAPAWDQEEESEEPESESAQADAEFRTY